VKFATPNLQHLSTFGFNGNGILNCLWLIKPTASNAAVELQIQNFNNRIGHGLITV